MLDVLTGRAGTLWGITAARTEIPRLSARGAPWDHARRHAASRPPCVSWLLLAGLWTWSPRLTHPSLELSRGQPVALAASALDSSRALYTLSGGRFLL